MRKLIGILIGLGLIAFGVVAFIGQSSMAERSGNVDDFYAGVVMGGLLGFAGLVTLIAVLRRRKSKSNGDDASSAIWAVGMNSGIDSDGDFDGDD
jgi:hypothetical protein